MQIKNHIIFMALCACVMLSGCTQWTITGQNSLWKVRPNNSGSQYGLVGIYSNMQDKDRLIRDETDAFLISLKTLYLKYVQDICDYDVIVYAEVYDLIGKRKELRRIAFHRQGQPPDSYVNVTGNLLYGPVFFSGCPVTVKFYVLELDKKQNESFTKFLEIVSSVASASQPQYAPEIAMASSIMKVFISLNKDDLEFSHEITFFPALDEEMKHYGEKASLVAPLEVGDFIIVKREDKDRVRINRWWWFDKRAEKRAKNKFDVGEVYYDAENGKLKHNSADKEAEISIGDDFQDKTYAVLTISRSSKALDETVLEEISTDSQTTLDNLLLDTEKTEEDQIAAIKEVSDLAAAKIKLFHIKNSVTGKSLNEKERILNLLKNEYAPPTTGTTEEKVHKIVREEIERLLNQLPPQ